MVTLNQRQAEALEEVAVAHRARVTARQDAQREAERMIAERISTAALTESRAVRRALALDIPRRQVGRLGLDTSDYATIGKILALTDHEAEAEAAVHEAVAAKRAEHLRPATEADRARYREHPEVWRLDWPGYTVADGGDFQTIHGVRIADLRGLLVHEGGDWLVLEDDLRGKFAPNPSGPLQDAIDWEADLREALDRAAK